MRYQVGGRHYGEMVLHYRTRHMLQELGIQDPKWCMSKVKDTKKEKGKSVNGKGDAENNNEDIKPAVNGNSIDVQENEGMTNNNNVETEVQTQGTNPQQRDKLNVFSPSGKEMGVKGNKDVFTYEDIKEELNNSISSKSHKLFCFSPSAKKIKKEQIDNCQSKKLFDVNPGDDGKEYRVVEIDDDICILEEVDEDVVWMGDDSCCFMDVTPPEIPMVDLSDETNITMEDLQI